MEVGFYTIPTYIGSQGGWNHFGSLGYLRPNKFLVFLLLCLRDFSKINPDEKYIFEIVFPNQIFIASAAPSMASPHYCRKSFKLDRAKQTSISKLIEKLMRAKNPVETKSSAIFCISTYPIHTNILD